MQYLVIDSDDGNVICFESQGMIKLLEEDETYTLVGSNIDNIQFRGSGKGAWFVVSTFHENNSPNGINNEFDVVIFADTEDEALETLKSEIIIPYISPLIKGIPTGMRNICQYMDAIGVDSIIGKMMSEKNLEEIIDFCNCFYDFAEKDKIPPYYQDVGDSISLMSKIPEWIVIELKNYYASKKRMLTVKLSLDISDICLSYI